MLKKLFVFLVATFGFWSSIFAEHLVGGEIYYECLGNDEYLITLKVYRDCYSSGAPFDSPAAISIYDNSGSLVTNLSAYYSGSQVLDVVINNPCLQAPPDVCVEEAVYTVSVNLPPIPGGYHVAYQRCCRNQSIVNLTNPDAQGSTYYVQIPEQALNSCNSSPYYNGFPPLALCIGEELVFDHSATDPDGDQLVYSLCTPFDGGSQVVPAPIPAVAPPYSNISWGGGYSSGFPIDATPAFAIDAATGELTGVPTQAGQYVVGVCVEEYRNGQLISSNKRDFQFNVVNCESNIAAIIPVQSSFHNPCSGLQVEFGNSSVNTQYYHWDFGVESILDDTSNLQNPTYTFPDTGSYNVTLIGNPGFACADTTEAVINVYDEIVIEIETSGDVCYDSNNFQFELTGQYGSGSTFFWEFEDAVPTTSTDAEPTGISFASLGTYNVTVTVTENSCTEQASASVETLPRPQAYFVADTLKGCAPLGGLWLDQSSASGDYEISWEYSDGVTDVGDRTLREFTQEGTYDLTITVWTVEGCIDTSVYTVNEIAEVWPVPEGELSVDTNIRFVFEPTFNFTGTSPFDVQCVLNTGDGTTIVDSLSQCTFEHFYTDTGDYVASMIFTDENGCQTSDSVKIRVEPEVRFWIPNAFTPNGDRLNDTWGPKAFGFSEYELWVYDRWGRQVFHSTDPFEKWDGTLNNKGNHEPVLGVYSYRVLAQSVKSLIIKESGHVTILR